MPNGLSILYVLTLVVLGSRHGKSILMDALREVFTTCMGGLPGLAFLPTPILIDMVAVPPYADSPVASVLDEEPGRTLKDIIIDSGCKVLAELSDAETSGDVRRFFSHAHLSLSNCRKRHRLGRPSLVATASSFQSRMRLSKMVSG